MTRARRGLLTILACTGLAAARASAGQDTPSEVCERTMVQEATNQGFSLRMDLTDRLDEQQILSYPVTLFRGNEYAFLACGGDGVRDLDIYLYDRRGELVARDSSEDERPVLIESPEATGEYLIRVKMNEGEGVFTLALLYRTRR